MGTPAGFLGHEGGVIAEAECQALATEAVALEDLARAILAGFAEPEIDVLETRPARAEDLGDEGDVVNGFTGAAGITNGHGQASFASS
jgi:hypothetical protein